MFNKVVNQIHNGNISPLYIVYGTEVFLQKLFLDVLTEALFGTDEHTLNFLKVDLELESIEQLLYDAETPPFMAERRLIVGTNAWFLTSVKGKMSVDHPLDVLKRYLKSPVESSVVVFTVNHEKLDERKKIVKLAKQRAIIVPAMPLQTNELQAWITKHVQTKGIHITQDATDALVMRTGGELERIFRELEKLTTFVGSEGTITIETVETLIPRTIEENVFKLIDCVANLKIEGALRIYYDLIKMREEPLKILALITRQIRLMLLVNELSKRGLSQRDMATTLSVHPYAVKVAGGQARRFTEQALQKMLMHAKAIDAAIKTGQQEKVFAVEWFLLRLPHLIR